MKLVFTKLSGKFDRLEIIRDGMPSEFIDCPKQRIIPHDMVHHAVESNLAARGFLGRVQTGEAAAFTMQAEPESDAVERLVEVFQGDAWSGGTASPADMIEMYRVTCHARECPMLPVSTQDIIEIRADIDRLSREWDRVACGESLTLMLDHASVGFRQAVPIRG